MNDFAQQDPAILRMEIFVGVLLLLIVAEFLWPRRDLSTPRTKRWRVNGGVFIIDAILTRGLGVIAGVSVSLWAAGQGIGLFNIVEIPLIIAAILCFIALDFAVWGQHVLSHHWEWLWRLHRVHHSDTDLDMTTALRFHPFEIGLSLLFKSCVIVLLGAPVIAVLAFEIILNASAMFNHSNMRLPLWADRVIRRVIVTPDFHRVHHSTDRRETDQNYGFFLSIWDQIFRTYTPQPRAGHYTMQIGLPEFREPKDQTIWGVLTQPFRSGSSRPFEQSLPSERE